MKGKMASFAMPYGCSPEDIRRLHLNIARFLIGVINTLLFRANSHAWLTPTED